MEYRRIAEAEGTQNDDRCGGHCHFPEHQASEGSLEFYLYHNNPEKVDLFKSGLWMPIEEKYYSDEQIIQSWTNNAAHPPEFRQAGIEYARDYAIKPSTSTLRNWPDIGSRLTERMETSLKGLYVAGNITGIESGLVAMAQGRLAAASMVHAAGLGGADGEQWVQEAIREVDFTRKNALIQFHPGITEARTHLAMALPFEQPIARHSASDADLWADVLLVFFGPGAAGAQGYSILHPLTHIFVSYSLFY